MRGRAGRNVDTQVRIRALHGRAGAVGVFIIHLCLGRGTLRWLEGSRLQVEGSGSAFEPPTPSNRFLSPSLPRGVSTQQACSFSGVNGTPLLRGIEFTHAPAQAATMVAGRRREGKLENSKK